MNRNKENNNAIVLIGSNSLAKIENSFTITNKLFRERSSYYLEIAKEKIHNRQWEGALIDLDKAIYFDDTWCEIYFYRGYAKRELQLHKESIMEFTNALNIDPNHIATLYQISYSLSSLGKFKDALFFVNKINMLEPNWYSFMQSATIKNSMGDVNGAKEDENKAWAIGHIFDVF